MIENQDTFVHQGIEFAYLDDKTDDLPVVFLHGLGGDKYQVKVLEGIKNIRRISMDFRGHGATHYTESEGFSMSIFADDTINLLENLGVSKAFFIGLSLGAAVGLQIAQKRPELMLGLVLLRPAWLDQPSPSNLDILAKAGEHLLKDGSLQGFKVFSKTPAYQHFTKYYPNAAQSIKAQFLRPQSTDAANALVQLIKDKPLKSIEDLKKINIPTLVIGNQADPMHPIEMAMAFAQHNDNFTFMEVFPRYKDEEQHRFQVQKLFKQFIGHV